MNRTIFDKIANFAEAHCVEIEMEFTCLGNLFIKMIRDEYKICRQISNFELNWLVNCDDAVCNTLDNMLAKLNEKPL